jgi:hypothetical protein
LKSEQLWCTYSASSLTLAASAAFDEAVDTDGCTGDAFDDVIELTGAGDEEVVLLGVFVVVLSLADGLDAAIEVTLLLVISVVVAVEFAVAPLALLVAVVVVLIGVVVLLLTAVVVTLLALLAAAP